MPFFVAGGLTLLNWIYAFFFLPESLKEQNRRKFEWKRANPFGTFKSLFQYEIVKTIICCINTWYICAAHAVQSNWSFYTAEKFGWKHAEIGFSLTIVGVAFAVVQGGLIRVIIPRLGQSRSVYVGLALTALGMILYAFASQSWMMFAFTAVYLPRWYCRASVAGNYGGRYSSQCTR